MQHPVYTNIGIYNKIELFNNIIGYISTSLHSKQTYYLQTVTDTIVLTKEYKLKLDADILEKILLVTFVTMIESSDNLPEKLAKIINEQYLHHIKHEERKYEKESQFILYLVMKLVRADM